MAAGSNIRTIAALCILITGCDRPPAAGEQDMDALPVLVAEAESRIGSFEDPDVGFSVVSGVDVDDRGHTYVLEASVPEIRVYDVDGSVLRRIGRRGEGPGEFGSAPRFGVVGDTVWAVDLRINRITLFDREGNLLSTGRAEGVEVPVPNGYAHVLPWRMRGDGKFTSHLARLAYLGRDDPPTDVRPTDRIPVPLVLFDATGGVTDTIGWAGRPPPRMWRPPSEESAPPELVQIGDRRLMAPTPPSTLPWWEPLPDGYLLVESPLARSADEGTVSVTRIGLADDTVYSRELRYRPRRYSSADLDSIAVRAARGEAGGMVPFSPAGQARPAPDDVDAVARALRGAMTFPEFQVEIQSVWLAQDGSLWLRRRVADGSPAHWVAIDPDGRVRGRLELPSNVRMMWGDGDVIWVVEPDDHDVQWLVRYRIGPG